MESRKNKHLETSSQSNSEKSNKNKRSYSESSYEKMKKFTN